MFNALAESASLHEFVKPQVDLSHDLEIVDGRHPVLAAVLPAGTFVPNSLTLNARDPQIIVLTGPNMSGKSTYLRQNALIAVMAQIGSFVPAKSARIGVVDKILTRIGAQDALAQGASTFMVEMNETSQILRVGHPAQPGHPRRGRPRHLHFRRHLHRLGGAGAPARRLRQARRARRARAGRAPSSPRTTSSSRSWPTAWTASPTPTWRPGNGPTPRAAPRWCSCTRSREGPADRSYGIHVAALAGLPPAVLARARRDPLQPGERVRLRPAGRLAGPAARRADPELPLFDDNPVLHALRLLNPESMTPLEALSAITALKKKL